MQVSEILAETSTLSDVDKASVANGVIASITDANVKKSTVEAEVELFDDTDKKDIILSGFNSLSSDNAKVVSIVGQVSSLPDGFKAAVAEDAIASIPVENESLKAQTVVRMISNLNPENQASLIPDIEKLIAQHPDNAPEKTVIPGG